MAKKRILVVDDDQAYSRFIYEALTTRGSYEVREENDGRQVLSAVREFHPHLVLLDVSLPFVSGDQIAAMMREDSQLRDIPIIYLTGLLRNEEGEDKELGHSLLLSKPVEVEKLLKCIQTKLEKV